MAYIGPPLDVVHRYGLTVGKMVDLPPQTQGPGGGLLPLHHGDGGEVVGEDGRGR